MKIAYTNGQVFTGKKIEKNKIVLVNNGQIEALLDQTETPAGYDVYDLKGDLLCPAFIDMQIYGGNGKMFSQELTVESLEATYHYCLSGGCAHFMITMATNSIEKFLRGMEVVDEYWKRGGKGLLGLHLEGPYLNPVKRGAHIEKYIKKPTQDEISLLLDKGASCFRMITLAPECCDQEIIDRLLKNNILVSAGHTNATYQQGTDGFNQGIPVATHLFNAMSGLLHRAPGMVGAIFDHPLALSSVVADGIHVDFAAIRIAKKVMGERLFYITDAVTENLAGEYIHEFKGDHFALPDGTLSGSSLTMLQCVKNGIRHLGLSLEDSLKMAGTIQSKFIRNKKIGVIEPGAEASLVILDQQLNQRSIVVA